ncbi:hypothetical protein HDU82_006032 [Entophlyctis luteolus]|nr:hypothetical protein HDU82_006032 [Entophlyctis luteolus]
METVAKLRDSLKRHDWKSAANFADDLLIDPDIDDSSYVQMCYGQASVLLQIEDLIQDFNIAAYSRIASGTKAVDCRNLRNAISFIMEGLNRAIDKNIKELIFAGACCFFRATYCYFQSERLKSLFAVPLSIVVKGLKLFPVDFRDLLICSHLSLANILLDIMKNKNSISNDVKPWPTVEDFEFFIQQAQAYVITCFDSALKLAEASSDTSEIQFQVTKAYLRSLQLNPSAKSAEVQIILANSALLRTYFEFHMKPEKGKALSNPSEIFAVLDQHIKGNQHINKILCFLIEISEVCLEIGNLQVCEEALRKASAIKGSSEYCTRRDLVDLQLEIKRIQHVKSEEKRLSAALFKLSNTLEKEPAVLQTACTFACSIISSLEPSEALVKSCTSVLKTLCGICETVELTMDAGTRCHFEHKLAKCYEFQSVFSLAIEHANKALNMAENEEVRNDIEILLHKLWIKANTFDGHLSEDLKALSLVDKAKYIPDDAVAFQLLLKAIKTIVLDHDLISPPATIENDAISSVIVQYDYCINFEIIKSNEQKKKRTILVALSDIMNQSYELAEKFQSGDHNEILKRWKMVYDSSRYLTSMELETLTNLKSAQKLKAQGLLLQGEALFAFDRTQLKICSKEKEPGKQSTQRIVDLFVQSLRIGVSLKDSAIIENAASRICAFFTAMSSSLLGSAGTFWTDTFQLLYECLTSNSLQHTNLMVLVCINYAKVLKELQDQANAAAALEMVAAAAGTVAEEKQLLAPAKGPAKGSRAPSANKTKAKTAPPPKSQPATKASQPNQSSLTSNKLVEEIFNVGMNAKYGAYSNKLALFDAKMSMHVLTPFSLRIETDPALKVFTSLEALVLKKPSSEDLEEAARSLLLSQESFGPLLNFELWLRIAEFSYEQKFLHMAYMAVSNIHHSSHPNDTKARIPSVPVKLVVRGHLLFARIVSSLVEEKIFFDDPVNMRCAILDKLASCIDILCNSQFAVDAFQKSMELIQNTLLSHGGSHSYQIYLSRVMSKIHMSFSSNNSLQTLMRNDTKCQCATMTLVKLLTEIEFNKKDWQSAIKVTDHAVRMLPKSFHTELLKLKVQATASASKSGLKALLMDESLENQFEMWNILSQTSDESNKKQQSFEECLKIATDNPAMKEKKLQTEIQYAIWIVQSCIEQKPRAITMIKEAYLSSKTMCEHGVASSTLWFFQASVLMEKIEPKRPKKYRILNDAATFASTILEPFVSLVSAETQASPMSVKSRSVTPVERGIFGLAAEKWIGLEWTPTAKDAFERGNISGAFSKKDCSDPMELISCLLHLVLELDATMQYQNCLPLLSLILLVLETMKESELRSFLLPTTYLYTSIIHSKLLQFEKSSKFRKICYSSEQDAGTLSENVKIDQRVGYPLDKFSLLNLKAQLLIECGDIDKAEILFVHTIFEDSCESSIASQNLCLFIKVLKQGSFVHVKHERGLELFNIRTATHAKAFAGLINQLIRSDCLRIIAGDVGLNAIAKSLSFIGHEYSDAKLVLMYAQFKLLAQTDITLEEIQEQFQTCLTLSEELENSCCKANLWLLYSKFVQRLAAKETVGRTKAKMLLMALDCLDQCGHACDEVKCAEAAAVCSALDGAVTIAKCDLLLEIANAGDLVDVANRTIEVMVDEHFLPNGTKPLSSSWTEVQHGAITQVLELTTKKSTSLSLPQKLRAHLIAAAAHKKKAIEMTPSSLNIAGEHFKSSLTHFSRGLKLAIIQNNSEIASECAEELLMGDKLCDDFTKFKYVAMLQSSESWKFLSNLYEEIKFRPKRVSFEGGTPEALCRSQMILSQSKTFKRTQPILLSQEDLADIPRNVKFLILKHSSDRKHLFGAVLFRVKESSGKSKSPIDDFTIATMEISCEVESIERLVAQVNDATILNEHIIDEIFRYLQPILHLLEPEQAKNTDKSETKKKTGKSGPEKTDGDRGHCIICCDSLLERLPLETVLRIKLLSTSASREFGVDYFLHRIKLSPFVAPETPSPAGGKKEKEKAPAKSETKWEMTNIKVLGPSVKSAENTFGAFILPNNLKIESLRCSLEYSEIENVFNCISEPGSVMIVFDKERRMNPLVISSLSNPPIVLSSFVGDNAESFVNADRQGKAKEIAGYCYLTGIPLSIVAVLPCEDWQKQTFAQTIINAKDSLKMKSEMTAEEVTNRKLMFGVYFMQYYGFF